MGAPYTPSRALLLIGTLFREEEAYYHALPVLCRQFGGIALEGPRTEWNYSDYYAEEMGLPLFRRFVFFKDLVAQDALIRAKHVTNHIEASFATDGNRTINLDPGYLTPAKLVLASTKDYAHRIYLGEGIFAEVTLIFRKGAFVPHINTYRDYNSDENLKVFMVARRMLTHRENRTL